MRFHPVCQAFIFMIDIFEVFAYFAISFHMKRKKMQELTQAHKDFLFTAKRELNILEGKLEPQEGRGLYFRADSILGGRFILIEAHYYRLKDTDAALWTQKDVIEFSGNIEDASVSIICLQHAMEMYDKKMVSEEPATNVVQLKPLKASP